jgi:ribosomal protein S18 acetylase RimI-like enzyme
VIATGHRDKAVFVARVWPLLERAEAENNLMLGLLGEPSIQPKIMVDVEEGGEVIAAALHTGEPFPLALSRCDERVAQAIADRVAGESFPSVLSAPASAAAFARRWSQISGVRSEPGRRQRIFSCEKVIPSAPVDGAMRVATVADIDLVSDWAGAFERETGAHTGGARKLAEERVRAGKIRLWDAGDAKSMAGFTGGTPNGVRVGFVYTPPGERGRGWASACVAALTDELLASGKRFVFLYTDLANPTSNKIYQAIGYRAVADADEHRFTP